jgi:hypothetical protein
MWSSTSRRTCVSTPPGRFPQRLPSVSTPGVALVPHLRTPPSHPPALTPRPWNLACSSIAGRRASGFLQVSLSKVSRHQHQAACPASRAETPPITLTTSREEAIDRPRRRRRVPAESGYRFPAGADRGLDTAGCLSTGPAVRYGGPRPDRGRLPAMCRLGFIGTTWVVACGR